MKERTMNRAEVMARLREMTNDVIRTATAIVDAVSDGAEPRGIADPEPWTIKAMYARRILAALDSGQPVNPAWLIGIAKATATCSKQSWTATEAGGKGGRTAKRTNCE